MPERCCTGWDRGLLLVAAEPVRFKSIKRGRSRFLRPSTACFVAFKVHLIPHSHFAGLPFHETRLLLLSTEQLVWLVVFFIPGTCFLPKREEFSPPFPGGISPPKGTTETFYNLPSPPSPTARAAPAPRASRFRCSRGNAGRHYLLLGSRSHRSQGFGVSERAAAGARVPGKGSDPSGARSGFPSSPSLRAATTRALI